MSNWLRVLSVILALSQSATLSAAAPNSALGLIDFDHDIGVVAAFHEEHFCLSIKNGKPLQFKSPFIVPWPPRSTPAKPNRLSSLPASPTSSVYVRLVLLSPPLLSHLLKPSAPHRGSPATAC